MECGGGTFETWLDTLQYIEFVAMTRAPLASCWFATFASSSKAQDEKAARNQGITRRRTKEALTLHATVCVSFLDENHGVTCHQVSSDAVGRCHLVQGSPSAAAEQVWKSQKRLAEKRGDQVGTFTWIRNKELEEIYFCSMEKHQRQWKLRQNHAAQGSARSRSRSRSNSPKARKV